MSQCTNLVCNRGFKRSMSSLGNRVPNSCARPLLQTRGRCGRPTSGARWRSEGPCVRLGLGQGEWGSVCCGEVCVYVWVRVQLKRVAPVDGLSQACVGPRAKRSAARCAQSSSPRFDLLLLQMRLVKQNLQRTVRRTGGSTSTLWLGGHRYKLGFKGTLCVMR
jgi:hypothetical protein